METERRRMTMPDGRDIDFLVAGPADGAPGLDWLAGMGPENVAEFGEAVRGEAALTAFLDNEAGGWRPTSRAPART
jgi:hypothetical protein